MTVRTIYRRVRMTTATRSVMPSRVSESDIRRVLNEYNSNESIMIPPDDYYEKIYINEYKDGSGYHVDIDLWYCNGRSDLTLQVDIQKKECNELSFKIDDLRVL